jgi:membrane associated rhomboid family serine protease
MKKILVTNILLSLIALSFVVEALFPGIKELFWLSRVDFQKGGYWRLVTVALVHGNAIHLILNLYALHSLGTPIEHYFGRTRYLIILVASLISGSSASLLMNNPYVISVGSSGMIFGLFGALALMRSYAGVEWRSISVIVGLNFIIGFLLGGVDWRGHLGGLIGGALVTAILKRVK